MEFLVLGGGRQGSAAAFDLARTEGVERVVVGDLDIEHPKPFLEPFVGRTVELERIDATDGRTLRDAMEGVDAVVCALPYFFNLDATEVAVEAGVHYCDLGGNTEIVERQRELDGAARAEGISVVPDCGLAPGMVNILAQAGIDELDETTSVRIRVGGLPQDPEPPLNYQIVYSMQGVLDYYTTDSLVLEEGRLVEKKALSEVEPVTFPEPLGELEAFHTAGGISTMPHRYGGVIPNMEYKTLRYPGHARIMRAIRDLGLLSREPVRHRGHDVVPRDFFIDVVSPRLRDPDGKDLVAVRVEVEGSKNGEAASVRYDLVDYYDVKYGLTAMMRTTGYSLAATALMQVDGRIDRHGVHTPDEVVPAGPYIDEMAARGVKIERV